MVGRLAVEHAPTGQGFRAIGELPFSLPADRWEELAVRGASAQRCLWASTATKDPAQRDVRYAEGLIGPETISTMPERTLRAFQDHGRVAPTLEQGLDEAERLLDRLAGAGLDYEAVTSTLEREGVEAFETSFRALLERLRGRRLTLAPTPAG